MASRSSSPRRKAAITLAASSKIAAGAVTTLRVLLTAAAYVLMQELRRRAAGTNLARAQVSTLRERLLKLGARLERSVRRIVLHLPRTAAYQHEWRRIALAVGAVPS